MFTHLRVVSESYLMNTNMTGFGWLSKTFASVCFGRKLELSSAFQGLATWDYHQCRVTMCNLLIV